MIQSLMTQEEYDACSRMYNTYNAPKRRSTKPLRLVMIEGREFQCGPPPNYVMGDALTHLEIRTINTRIDAVLKKAGLIKHQTWNS